MKVGRLSGDKIAYATYVGASASIYWNTVRVWGKIYDCRDRLLPIGHPVYLWLTIEKGELEDALAYAAAMSPCDLRSLNMLKSGCCPHGLVNEILDSGPM